MVFLEDISQTIVENTSRIIGYPISITDEKGYIIGSSDTNRLGSFHQASIDVLRKKETICYEYDEVKNLTNVLPGVATPIIIDQESVGVLGIVGNPTEVKKYAQLVKSHVELMCHEYLKKEMRILESKTLDNLIHYLLNSDNIKEMDQIIRFGKMLGYNLGLEFNRVCLIIEVDLLTEQFTGTANKNPDKFSWQFLQNNIMDLLRYYLIDNKEDILSSLTLDQFILIKAIDPAETPESFAKQMQQKISRMSEYIQSKYQFDARISIGSMKKGINGIKESYEESIKTLIAGKRTNISPKVYYYNDWNIILELIGTDLPPYIAERLSDKMNCFFQHVNFPTLSFTFTTYCQCNMNISETARSLFLHRNSLVYQLEKISELTCLDITNFEHCLLLYFAIKNSGQEKTPAHSLILKNADRTSLP
ncbi:transcriptional regulator [Bacillus sp. MUM 116]|nr:sugar diacid recognition domain-containing protein [Bacillus sp. MUM 116]OIK08972.1 transcriptional regulator [Bacillus sp. MUM 116]